MVASHACPNSRHAKGPAIAENIVFSISSWADPGSDPIPAYRLGGPGFAVSPSVAWWQIFKHHVQLWWCIIQIWPTPGPAKSSEPAIIAVKACSARLFGPLPGVFFPSLTPGLRKAP